MSKREREREREAGSSGAPERWPLEPGDAVLARWLDAVGTVIRRELAATPEAPARGVVGPAGVRLAAELSRPIPEAPDPGGMAAVVEHVVRASKAALGPQTPGYLAYIPGGGLPATAFADLLADTLNRYSGVAAAAPGFARLEADVLAWLAGELGYDPQRARGLLTSGGSLATFAAIVTARHHAFGDSGELAAAKVYTSSQAHHSVAKAAALAGIPRANVEAIAVDERYRLDLRDLAARITADLTVGARPFAIVSAAGTTNTGAVDPLDAIGALAETHGLWHHVDAAYGGSFALCEEGKRRLAGLSRSDSITFDPHKGMFLPYGTGCLLVADGEHLRRAHGAEAAYLQDFDPAHRDAEPPSPAEYGPELSRPFRGLRLWLPLMLHGAAAFREANAEKLALAEHFAAGLHALIADGAPIELVDAPQLTVVPFRLRRGDGETLAAWNGRNARWQAAVNDRVRVHLSSTALPVADGEAFTLRVCVLSFRTHVTHVDAALDDLAATWKAVV